MITPKVTDTPKEGGGFEKRVMIGVSGALAIDVKTETPSFFPTLWNGTKQVWNVIVMSLDGLRHIIRGASDKVLNMAMSIGFVLLMALMVFATYNDIVRLIT